MTKSFHPTGQDEEVDDALEDLRRGLDELREMEHTTEWPDVEIEAELVEQDEDMTPILASTATVAPSIPVSLAEEKKVALQPKDKQSEIPFPEKMDVSSPSKPVLTSPKGEDDEDDEGLLELDVSSPNKPVLTSPKDEDDEDDEGLLELPGESSLKVFMISSISRTSTC
jgi:hypothetical protein